MVTHQLQVEHRTGKVRRPETDVLPLCYATNLEIGKLAKYPDPWRPFLFYSMQCLSMIDVCFWFCLLKPSVLWRCWLGSRKGIRPVKNWVVGCWHGNICLEWGADLHTAQLMLLPLTVSCFSKIQIGFTFLVPAHLGSLGKMAIKCVYCWIWINSLLCCATVDCLVTCWAVVRNIVMTTTTTVLQVLYRSTCISWHFQLRTGGFCWCEVLLPACPCWRRPAYSD